MVTVCYVHSNTGYTQIIAISKDRRKTEKAMFDWCKEREIVPEYHHGDYIFQKETAVGTISGWLKFEEIEVIP